MSFRNTSYLCVDYMKNTMTGKNYKVPAIVWLKVTDYMHGWIERELGGEVRCREQRVVSVQHLEGAREVLRMETVDDTQDMKRLGLALSATRMKCMLSAVKVAPTSAERLYGATEDVLALYLPIECPKMCLTRNGVLRPWTLDVCLGKEQARHLLELLRREFWAAVEEFDLAYAEGQSGRKYPAKDMVEAFCTATRTPDMYVDAIRREWQRRRKREKDGAPVRHLIRQP